MSSWLQLSRVMDTLDEMKKATPYISFYFLDIMFGHSGPDVDSEYLYFLKSGLTTQIVYNFKIMDNNGHSVSKVFTVMATFQKINLPQVGGSTLLSSTPKGKTELHTYVALSLNHTLAILLFTCADARRDGDG